MPVTTPKLPTQSIDTAPEYKDNIDATMRVNNELAGNFAPHEVLVNSMNVEVEAGKLWNESAAAYFAVALQTTALIVAPTTNPRIDRVYIDTTNGVVGILAGTEAASPAAPAYAANQYPLCQIALIVSQTTITNLDLIDERPLIHVAGGGAAFEEGNWTPRLQDTSNSDAEGQTYSIQRGRYIKIGRFVHLNGWLSMSSLGTLSTNLQIVGLPYNILSQDATNAPNIGFIKMTNANFAAPYQVSFQGDSGDRLFLKVNDTISGGSNLLPSQLSASVQFQFTMNYISFL